MGMRQALSSRVAAAPTPCYHARNTVHSSSTGRPCRTSSAPPRVDGLHAWGAATTLGCAQSCSARCGSNSCRRSLAAQAVAADLLTFKWDDLEPEDCTGGQQQVAQQHEDGPTPTSSSSDSYDPVCLTRTVTLPTVTSWPAAAAALSAALQQQAAPLAALPAACLRLEVGLPLQRSTSALRWLLGQPAPGAHQVYFSQRHSTAPDTPGAVAAAAASAGWTSLAGHGAAWVWRGPPGTELGAAAVSSCRRFLSESSPRVRVLGGGRFDPQQAPAPEWASFGSHCFVLPQLEVTEADQVLLLAVTVAWDAR